MKKFLSVMLVVALCLTCALALTACAQEEVKAGEYSYANPYSATAPKYGVKVNVTVKGDTIVKVELVDSDYVRTSSSWVVNANEGDLGYEATEAAYADYLARFEGKKVADILALTVTTAENGTPSAISSADYVLTGATQSSGRIVLAIQNAIAE